MDRERKTCFSFNSKRQKAGNNFVPRETNCEGRKAKILINLLKLFATIPNQTFRENQVTIH